jgi:hypothetical protein
MERPRAADDFAVIRARMEELKREREQGALRVRSPSERRLDEQRWQVAEELRERVLPGRHWSPR